MMFNIIQRPFALLLCWDSITRKFMPSNPKSAKSVKQASYFKSLNWSTQCTKEPPKRYLRKVYCSVVRPFFTIFNQNMIRCSRIWDAKLHNLLLSLLSYSLQHRGFLAQAPENGMRPILWMPNLPVGFQRNGKSSNTLSSKKPSLSSRSQCTPN